MKKQANTPTNHEDSGFTFLETSMNLALKVLDNPTADGAAVNVELAKLYFEMGKLKITHNRK
jgi:hypothetical protein